MRQLAASRCDRASRKVRAFTEFARDLARVPQAKSLVAIRFHYKAKVGALAEKGNDAANTF